MKKLGEIIKSMPDRKEECPIHGEYVSSNPFGNIWTKCPECSRIEKERQSEEERIQKDREKALRWQSKLKTSMIPDRFKDKRLDTYIADTPEKQYALNVVKTYAVDFEAARANGSCLVLCGKPGTGKTHLASGAAIHVIENGYTALFITVMSAMRRIKATWDRNSDETESDAISVLCSPDLLVLDEIGIQTGSETEQNLIFSIINDRYESRKPTIVISNLNAKGVRDFLGERSFDRLREDGGQLIVFTWESYRGSGNAS